MNKEKLIAKIDKAINANSDEKSVTVDYETGETLNTYVRMGLYIAKEIIQSEPEEKTNFDVITESPEKLAEFIMEIQNDTKNGQEWLIDEHCVSYLNKKAGE